MNLFSGLCIVAATLALVLACLALRLHFQSKLNKLVSLLAVAYAFWALWSAFAYADADPVGYLFFLRVGLAGYLVIHIVVPRIVLLLVGIHRWKAWVLMFPPVIWSAAQGALIYSGHWIVSDSSPSPWGAVGILNTDPFPMWVTVWGGLVNTGLGVGILVWAWKTHCSRRLRAILGCVLGMLLLHGILSRLGAEILWKRYGFPDPTVLVGILPVIGTYLMVFFLRHLVRTLPRYNHDILNSLCEPVILLSVSGQIILVNQRMANLLEFSEAGCPGNPIDHLLKGWPGIKETVTLLEPSTGALDLGAGLLGKGKFSLCLYPIKDHFGDLELILVKVIPLGNLDEAIQRFRISPREHETARLLLEGLGTQAIADKLYISTATVKNHIHKLFLKTGTSNRVELINILKH